MKSPIISRDALIDMLISSRLWKNRRITRCSIVAVRGFFGNNKRGIYDDAMFVLSPCTLAGFNGNTDPSRSRRGIAMLEAHQKIIYRPGPHGYGRPSYHMAFRQASDVVVVRDGGVGNGRSLGSGRFTDKGRNRFWTNLHKGGNSSTSSAGCLTIPANQWPAFHELTLAVMRRYSQKTFACNLIDIAKA